MQYIVEIDEKYYTDIFKDVWKLLYIYELILSILLVMITGSFVIVFYEHVYVSEIIRFVISLIWHVIVIYFPQIYGKHMYLSAKKKRRYGRAMFEFDDTEVKVTYIFTNEIYEYSIAQIKKVIRFKKHYVVIVPRRRLCLPIETGENQYGKLEMWFQKQCAEKYRIH